MPGQKSLTFPAPEGDSGRGAEKSSFSAQIPNLRPNNPIIRYSLSGQGGFWGGFSPFLAKIRHFHSHFRLTFCGQLWGIWGGTSKKGQKWPKMVKNGQKWSKMAKNGLFGGSLGKPPPPPPFLRFKSCLKTPVFAKRAIFQDFWIGGVGGGGRFWPKMAILGVFEVEINFEFKSDQNLGSQKWPEMVKMGISGGFPGGVENDHF